MNAREARRLRVGQFIVTAFSNSHRKAQINRIEWPHFLVTTTLASGKDQEERRLYRSLFTVEEYTRQYGSPKG